MVFSIKTKLWICVDCGAGYHDELSGCDSCGGGKLELKKVDVPENPFDNRYRIEG